MGSCRTVPRAEGAPGGHGFRRVYGEQKNRTRLPHTGARDLSYVAALVSRKVVYSLKESFFLLINLINDFFNRDSTKIIPHFSDVLEDSLGPTTEPSNDLFQKEARTIYYLIRPQQT